MDSIKGHINKSRRSGERYPWEYWVGGGEALVDYGSCRTWIQAVEEVEHVLGNLGDYDLHSG